MKENKFKSTLPIILTISKYIFSLILTFVAYTRVSDPCYLIIGIAELLIIFTLSNILMKKKILGRIVNSILLLLYNAQMVVMVFGNSYITMLMLTNIDSIKALSGKAGIYITGVLIVLIFTFLPIKRISSGRNTSSYFLSAALCLELVLTLFFGNTFSPLYGYCDLGIQHYESVKLEESIAEAAKNQTNEEEVETSPFYNKGIEDFKQKNDNLIEQPNVILIFTEGLSQNVISDSRSIMPNIAEYQQKSFCFTNYFNHTFATYRGLIGQLYSGHQLEDFDSNPLISIQSIFSDEGYNTCFINTEPNNKDFTKYLESFGFDKLYGDTDSECNGMADTISDKDAYEMIFDIAKEQEETGEPFFLSIYTFGTHASLDSTDQKFGNGTDAELNKFYDVDYQFGKFMKKFNRSSLADNTIIIFTADHATYQDDSFIASFPDYPRAATSIDEIPFFIYYDGITPGSLDVNGRNSICLAPTIFDYLDISAPNYFLGTSLFSDKATNIQETSYSDLYATFTSKNGQVAQMDEADREQFNKLLEEYYITKAIKANK